MRIEFLTQDDPIYVLPFFEEFLRNYGSEFEVLQISLSRAMGKRSRVQLTRELAALYGFAGMARLAGRAAVARVFGKLPRTRNSPEFYSVEQLARSYDVPVKRIGSPNDPEFIEAIRRRSAEVICSVACPYIINQNLLTLPPRGCINIHHAPLPRYKGMMPTFWQLYHGEKKVGVTVHYMAAKIDEGAALFQDELQIEAGETLDHLIRRTKRHGAHCMARVLRQIAAGREEKLQLDQSAGSYFTFPKLEEIREFRRRGYRAI